MDDQGPAWAERFLAELSCHEGNQARAARVVGVDPSTVRRYRRHNRTFRAALQAVVSRFTDPTRPWQGAAGTWRAQKAGGRKGQRAGQRTRRNRRPAPVQLAFDLSADQPGRTS